MVKNYLIETTTNGYFVHAGDTPYGGPYKNEESAKRRIRDLKRKDNEAVAIETAKLLANSKPAPVEQPPIVTPINGLEIRETAPLPNVEKLAASSEYGKFNSENAPGAIYRKSNALAAGMNNLDMSKFKIARHVPRQVGCYPAISKHAYQR